MPEPKKPLGKAPHPTSDTPGATWPAGTGGPLAGADADTPAARLAAAIAGKPPKSLVEVRAADVVELAGQTPAEKLGKVPTALRDGAARALAERPAAEELRVYQVAGQVALLLEATREPVPEAP